MLRELTKTIEKANDEMYPIEDIGTKEELKHLADEIEKAEDTMYPIEDIDLKDNLRQAAEDIIEAEDRMYPIGSIEENKDKELKKKKFKLSNKVIGITLAVLLLFGACTLSKDMALRVAMLTTSPSKAFTMIYKDAGKDVQGNSIYTVDAGKKSEKTFIVYKHGPLYFAKGV